MSSSTSNTRIVGSAGILVRDYRAARLKRGLWRSQPPLELLLDEPELLDELPLLEEPDELDEAPPLEELDDELDEPDEEVEDDDEDVLDELLVDGAMLMPALLPPPQP